MAAVTARRGHSLLEVLVAILVVGIGALGIAKLHMLSARNNRLALEYSMATILAEDMLERIRANPSGVYAGTGVGQPPPSFVDCLASDCTPAQLATFDVAAWKCGLGRWRNETPCQAARGVGLLAAPTRQPGLPEGDGSIAIAGAVVTVTVTWPNTAENSVAISTRR